MHPLDLNGFVMHNGVETASFIMPQKQFIGFSAGFCEISLWPARSIGQSWHFLDFSNGKGTAFTNELDEVTDVKLLKREEQKLKSRDILAVKGLAQFERFPAVMALGNLIENWHTFDFHIKRARPEQEAGYAEHLSSEGENLSLVTEFLYKRYPELFKTILSKLAERVPGIEQVRAKTTEEGRVLLRFKDGAFENPFLVRYVSDGTIKMFAYFNTFANFKIQVKTLDIGIITY